MSRSLSGIMRTSVTFQHPAAFVPVSDEEGVLATRGAGWFVELLRKVPGVEVDGELCQEDWGVVVFVRRRRRTFWIGLSRGTPTGPWLAHVHHGSWAWWQRFSPAGKSEFASLLAELHRVLASDPMVSGIGWHEEKAMRDRVPSAFATPFDS
ncbi:MAG: hypothetical protein ACTHLZ_04135 [Tepidisphaeraceae bacterium]